MVIRQTVPDKKTFEGFLKKYGFCGPLGHLTQIPRTNFLPPTHRGSTQNLASVGQAVSEKKMFEHFGRRTADDGLTLAGPLVCFKLIYEPSGELNQRTNGPINTHLI